MYVCVCVCAQEDAASIVGVSSEQADPVRKAASRFVEWLQEDEDDDDE